MAQHEKSYLQHFGDHLRDEAARRGVRFQCFDMDAQDRKALADMIFTNYDYFVLVEGKNSEKEIVRERRKLERVTRLCRGLTDDPAMLRLHDTCHFITWRDSQSTKLELDIYRSQVCTASVLGTTCELPPPHSGSRKPFRLSTFSTGFFHTPPPPQYAIDRSDFEVYVHWLVTTVTAGDSSEVELVGQKCDEEGDIVSVMLPSLADVYQLLDEHRNSPSSSYGFEMDGP